MLQGIGNSSWREFNACTRFILGDTHNTKNLFKRICSKADNDVRLNIVRFQTVSIRIVIISKVCKNNVLKDYLGAPNNRNFEVILLVFFTFLCLSL